jgi:transcriptional regulator
LTRNKAEGSIRLVHLTMYVPAHFKVDDPAALKAFMGENSFATLITHSEGNSLASHLPVLCESGEPLRLLGHMARANPQWRHFGNNSEVLVIFHGPHAYISPFWYEAREAVPTWNYAAVHAYGRAKIIEDVSRAREVVENLTRHFEAERAAELFAQWSEPFVEKMLKGIVAFELELTRLEGKFKLGQNRCALDIANVLAALSRSQDQSDHALARFMSRQGLA